MRLTQRGTAAALIVFSLVLAGCSGGSESDELAGSSNSAPALTEPWQQQTEDGAVEFAHHWVEALHEAEASGNTDDFHALGPECNFCNDFVASIDAVYTQGGSIKGPAYEVVEATLDGEFSDTPTITLTYKGGKVTWIRREGAKPETFPGGEITNLMTLRWTEQGWLVDQLADT